MISAKRLKTGPVQNVVTISEAKQFLKIDSSDDDLIVQNCLDAAEIAIENYLEIKINSQVWEFYFNEFPADNILNLPFGPVISVQAFKTIDTSSVEENFTEYLINSYSTEGQLVATGQWPSATLQEVNGIKIEATIGFSAIPKEIKQAVLLILSKFYEQRGDSTQSEFFGTQGFTIPNTALVLIEPYRRLSFE